MPDSRPFHLPTLLHGADYNYEQWLAYPDVLRADLELMKVAGINALSIGIFSWAMLKPSEGHYAFDWLDKLMDTLAKQEIRALLATPSGARPAWLSEAYPEVRQVNSEGIRAPHAGRHNHCRTSPVYREKCRTINTLLAERYAEHPALFMWHVSNEYGAGACHCSLCYTAFQDWLRARYGDLETLNHAWWTTFWSHRYTAWEQIKPVDPSVQGLLLDWQRFTSDQTLDFFIAESAPLRKITPSVPVTTNFMQPDVGLDYWALAPHVDIISWDSYPRWHHPSGDAAIAAQTAFYHDLHRSYKHGPFMLMESTPSVTNWQGISRPKRPGMHLLSSLQAVAHGSNTVQYFQWRQSRGGEEKYHGAVVSHLSTPDTRVFREVAEVGARLETLAEVVDAEVQVDVAIIYDFHNEWALNHAQLPQNEAKDYQACCREHHEALWRQGVGTDIISSEADFGAYRVVIAPMLYMLRAGVAERLEAFVRAGGVLVTTHTSGMVDDSDLAFLGVFPDPLRRTLGLQVEETDNLYDDQRQEVKITNAAFAPAERYETRHVADIVRLETAQPLGVFDREFYRGSPALTLNRHGVGNAFYLATRFGTDFLFDFYAKLTEHSEIERWELPSGVSVSVRRTEDFDMVFVMNFSDAVQSLPVPERYRSAAAGTVLELTAYEAKVLRVAVEKNVI